MKPEMKFPDLPSRIAAIMGCAELRVKSQILHPGLRKMLKGEPDPSEPNGGYRFHDREAYRAAIFLFLEDVGFPVSEFNPFASALDREPDVFAGDPEYADNSSGLDCIIRGISENDPWDILILFNGRADRLPGREYGVHILRAAQLDNPNSYAQQFRGQLGTLRIPASVLLGA